MNQRDHIPATDPATEVDLVAALPLDAAAVGLLQARLVDAAAAEGVLDIAYRTLDTPVGELLLATTEQGLVRVAYASEDHHRVLSALADRISPRILRAPARLDAAARELDEYFAGRRTRFGLAVDLRLAHGFRRDVLARLADVDYGTTVTYAGLAKRVGHATAVRAVGTACATNPVPVVVPCHRVVRTDGTRGGYLGGAEAKDLLLTLEADVRRTRRGS